MNVKQVGNNNGDVSSNNCRVENYRRIKIEEAAARAQLMNAPGSRGDLGSAKKAARNMGGDLNALAAHRRNPTLLDHKYKPSEHALAAYSPLRNGAG